MYREAIQILLIEDNPGDARLLQELMTEAGMVRFKLTHVDRLSTGLERLAGGDFDVVLLDLSLPDSHGLETLIRLHTQAPSLPIVVLTGLENEALGVTLVQTGAQDYLVKGQVTSHLLVRSIRYAIERMRSEEALRESEARYRLVARVTFNAIWDWDLVRNEVTWNEGVQTLFGYSADDVKPQRDWWVERIHLEDRARIITGLNRLLDSGEQIWSEEYRFCCRNGSYASVIDRGYVMHDDDGKPVRMIGAMLDITERKQLEEQLRQSQKMEVVGRLAGGIAHDFNNLLTVITGYSKLLLQRDMDEHDPLRKYVVEIDKAGERAAALTHQLLAFSRKQILQPEVLDLNVVIAEMDKMLQRLIGEDINLVTIPGKDLGWVKADPGQMEQVIVNLAVNARDAMPQGGKLTIETANVELDERYARQRAEVTSGPYVMLAVSDTGVGITEETLSHIFEPFFTTKEQGKGTGLGLATAYGIVKQSGGHLWVYSEVGRGTMFKVYLPRLGETGVAVEPGSSRPGLPQGSETILLVEDEAGVRELILDVLTDRGYIVLEARDGNEALRLCEQHSSPIHLLLTDVVMPGGMNGRELAERLTSLHPELKVLYMSGYTDEAIIHHGVLDRGTIFLQKPFTPNALERKAREVLDMAN
jgi:PAS domain S-box-containing protein